MNDNHLPNNMITDHRAFIPSLDSLLSADNLLSNNLYFSMDKEKFCFFMEMHGYQFDKTVMPEKSTTLKFTSKTRTIFFQKATIDNKRLFTVLMISYKDGDVESVVFNYDASLYEITYRSNKEFHIIKKTTLSRYTDGSFYYQFMVDNSLYLKCYLSSFCVNKGVIKDVLYYVNDKCYPLNKLLNALGKPEIEVSAVSNYLDLVNLFTDDDAILIEMALC